MPALLGRDGDTDNEISLQIYCIECDTKRSIMEDWNVTCLPVVLSSYALLTCVVFGHLFVAVEFFLGKTVMILLGCDM